MTTLTKRWKDNCPKCGGELGIPGFNERFCPKCMIAELDDPEGPGGIWAPILTCVECKQPLVKGRKHDSYPDEANERMLYVCENCIAKRER